MGNRLEFELAVMAFQLQEFAAEVAEGAVKKRGWPIGSVERLPEVHDSTAQKA